MNRWRELLETDWAELLPISQTLPWIGILVSTHFCHYITLLLKRIDTMMQVQLPKESDLQALPRRSCPFAMQSCRCPAYWVMQCARVML